MTNIVRDQNRREAAKSQRKLWDVKSGQFIIILNGTENCVPKPYELFVGNSCLTKKSEHLVSYLSGGISFRSHYMEDSGSARIKYHNLSQAPRGRGNFFEHRQHNYE